MLSIAIIAKDEERYIGGCLDSVADLAHEIVVLLDDRSSDATAAICRQQGVRLYIERWRGFPGQRNYALQLCRGNWVLFIDADERVTPELRAEIATVLAADAAAQQLARGQVALAGYWIPRHNFYFKRKLRGGGWYPDRQLRLLRRGHASYDEARLVHEFAQLTGPAGELGGHLLHYNIDRLDEFWHKQTLFAAAEAHTLYKAGVRVRSRTFVVAPLREFWRRYVRLGGWHDGWRGLFLCSSLAWFELLKYLRLWSMLHTTTHSQNE